MAETYDALRDRFIQQYKAKGVPEQQAVVMAQKRASRIFNRSHAQDKVSTIRRHARKSENQEFVDNLIMEIHGITGLIGAGGIPSHDAATAGGTGGVTNATLNATSGGSGSDKSVDPSSKKAGGAGKGKSGSFAKGAAPTFKVTHPGKGRVTGDLKRFEDITSEFGIK